MIKSTLLTSLLVFLCAVPVLTQYDEERRREEDQEQLQKLADSALQSMSPTPFSLVNLAMPDTENAWTITISRSGGLLGQSARLVAALNSDGFFTCDAGEPQNVTLSGVSYIDDITEIFRSSTLKALRKSFSAQGGFCNDCTLTTMQIANKNKKKTGTSVFSWIVLPESDSKIGAIYNSVLSSTECGK